MAAYEVVPQLPNPRREPCPNCGGVGCVESYPNDRIPHTFCFRCSSWTPLNHDVDLGDAASFAQRAQEIEREKQRQHHAAAQAAQKLWSNATSANPQHPYLVRKQVEVFDGVRQNGDELLIPVLDLDGKLWSVQRITPTGNKIFLQGSRKQGHCFVIGSLKNSKIICFCEGYTTGATIFQATEYPTVVCFDAGNLFDVALEFQKRYPNTEKVICADNDQWDSAGNLRTPAQNVGVIKATLAAKSVSGILVVPEFPTHTHVQRPSDFNDMAKIISLNAVRERIHGAVLPQASSTVWLFSDYGNALILLEHLADELAYTPGLGWLGYNTTTGIWDFEPGTERIRKKALEKLREVWQQRLQHTQQQLNEIVQQLKHRDEDDDSQLRHLKDQLKTLHGLAKNIRQWITQCESAHRIRSTLEVSEGYLWTDPCVWDANKDILVCKNGVLNLMTGQLVPFSPDFRATKRAGAAYDPHASHPAWDAMIELLQAEGDRYSLIQQFCGSGLYGANPSEQILIAQGTAGTGKGTLLTAVHAALGDYCSTIEMNSLLQTDWRKQNKSAPREDLLKLRGARFVYPSIEPPKNAKLDDGSIKALSANDVISYRYPYAKQSISFVPVFTLVLQTNFPLRTEFDDPGMKRRVVVCPFNQKPEVPDPSVKAALMHDETAKSAVLAWLFQGFTAWREAHYQLPTSEYANQATGSYWADMDPYADFARENLVFAKHAQTTKKDMSEAFKQWKEDSGRRDASSRELVKWLISKGVVDYQDSDPKRTRIWSGVGLLCISNILNNLNTTFSKQDCGDFENKPSTTEFPGNHVQNVQNVQTSHAAEQSSSDEQHSVRSVARKA